MLNLYLIEYHGLTVYVNSMGELLQIEKEEPDDEEQGGAGWCLGVKENGQRGTSPLPFPHFTTDDFDSRLGSHGGSIYRLGLSVAGLPIEQFTVVALPLFLFIPYPRPSC